jgi:site-specific DNA-methyltransferase (adenine-specific)
MALIPAESVDMILCDLPYGMIKKNRHPWDCVIPFDKLWEQYERVIKNDGAIVLTASQPFTSKLVMSNPKLFRYEWIWQKNQTVNFQNAKRQPLKVHESVLVFYKKLGTYHPQGIIRLDKPQIESNRSKVGKLGHITVKTEKFERWVINYPKTIQKFGSERGLHPTQKPVTLFEYLIRTYTNSGATVLDNCAGSFTTAIASDNTGRNWICIEKESGFSEVGLKRVNENRAKLNLEPVELTSMKTVPVPQNGS